MSASTLAGLFSADLQKRDLGMALIEEGVERRSPKHLVAGYRMLTQVQQQFHGDSQFFNSLGSASLLGQSNSEVAAALRRAVLLDPGSSPQQANLEQMELGSGQTELAQQHLERALELDPLNFPAIADLLHLRISKVVRHGHRILLAEWGKLLHTSSMDDSLTSARK